MQNRWWPPSSRTRPKKNGEKKNLVVFFYYQRLINASARVLHTHAANGVVLNGVLQVFRRSTTHPVHPASLVLRPRCALAAQRSRSLPVFPRQTTKIVSARRVLVVHLLLAAHPYPTTLSRWTLDGANFVHRDTGVRRPVNVCKPWRATHISVPIRPPLSPARRDPWHFFRKRESKKTKHC